MLEEKKIKMIYLKTGILWPHYEGKKAISASFLTKLLKDVEYKNVPFHILQKAATKGKMFHKAIQFFLHGKYKMIDDLKKTLSDEKLGKKISDTIIFLKKVQFNYLDSEKLYYSFYKGTFLATYIDLEFEKFVIELKTNRFTKKKSIILLIFEIQLLIQYICTKKDIYILWNTGNEIIFNKFRTSKHLFKILDMLIDLMCHRKEYSDDVKRQIVKKIFQIYNPSDIFF